MEEPCPLTAAQPSGRKVEVSTPLIRAIATVPVRRSPGYANTTPTLIVDQLPNCCGHLPRLSILCQRRRLFTARRVGGD